MSTPVYGPAADDPEGDDDSGLSETLQTFASSPQGFILGAILSPLIDGLNSVVVRILDLIVFVFRGDGPGLTGTLGLADIPLFIGNTLVDAGAVVGGSARDGTGILGVLDTIVEIGVGFADIGGPLAPIILAAEVVAVVYLLVVIARRVILVIADALPGVAGLLGT